MTINSELEKAGFLTRFNISRRSQSMEDVAKAIDKSIIVVTMLTKDFIVNVAGQGPGGANNICKRVFDYAVQCRGAEKMIPVVLEERCCDPWDWHGPVFEVLGKQQEFNLSSSDSITVLPGGVHVRDGMKHLIKEVARIIAATPAVPHSSVHEQWFALPNIMENRTAMDA